MLSFKKHVDLVCGRASKRLNVLRILAQNGTDPPTLMKLYQTYIRPILEYGSISFLSAPKAQHSRLQQIQNEAIRICLKLPRCIRTSLLHDYASIDPIFTRFLKLNKSLLNKMTIHNAHIKSLVSNHFHTPDIFLSPLDVLIES